MTDVTPPSGAAGSFQGPGISVAATVVAPGTRLEALDSTPQSSQVAAPGGAPYIDSDALASASCLSRSTAARASPYTVSVTLGSAPPLLLGRLGRAGPIMFRLKGWGLRTSGSAMLLGCTNSGPRWLRLKPASQYVDSSWDGSKLRHSVGSARCVGGGCLLGCCWGRAPFHVGYSAGLSWGSALVCSAPPAGYLVPVGSALGRRMAGIVATLALGRTVTAWLGASLL